MKKAIFLLMIILCSCGHRVSPVKGGAKVKEKKHVHTTDTFLMVACFMLGFCITQEYIKEK